MQKLKAVGNAAATEQTPDPWLSPGSTLRYFGDYEILEELGRGGMGVVYRARQVSLNRAVALKLILAGQLALPAEVRRFRNEAEAAGRLDHPNIVPIYEIGEHEGRHYFSMKLVEGESLSEHLSGRRRRQEALTPNPQSAIRYPQSIEPPHAGCYSGKQAAALVATVAKAVHYAHQRGILHRDLKPANILLDASGQPHLTDFGLAKLLESDSSLTRSQAVMGTPDYMSPEVAAGKAKEVTTAADVFSLGAILYELLAGCPPFREESAAATLQKVLHAEPRPPRAIDPGVPRDLETVALKCLEKEPARRYSSAAAVADELERFARGETILARPLSSPERVVRWGKRKPALAALSAALLFVLTLGLAGIVWQWQRAEEHANRAERALTKLEIEQADALLETRDDAKGLAQLARVLRRQPDNRVATERLFSALTLRPFGLPVAPLRHGPSLHSWRTANQPQLRQVFPFCYIGSVAAANFSPDGRRLVTASEDGTARIWDALAGQPIGRPLQHKAEVLWAEFSPDGMRVVTASMDHTARVWDANTGAAVSPPLAHTNIVWHAAFSPDGRQVISASQDRTARLWDATTGASLRSPLEHPQPVIYAAFSPDGLRILTAERGSAAYVWDRLSGAKVTEVIHQFMAGGPRAFPQFNARGDQVLSIQNLSVWLSNLGTPLARPKQFGGDSYVREAAFAADPRQIAVATGYQVRMLDIATERRVMVGDHRNYVLTLQASADGKRLLTASLDHTARLWDLTRGGRPLAALNHQKPVLGARLSADQRRAVTIQEANKAWLWQMRAAPVAIVCSNEANVYEAWFSPDGRSVLCTTATGSAVWESSTGRQLSVPPRTPMLFSACPDVHFGTNGPLMARVASSVGAHAVPSSLSRTVFVHNAMSPDATAIALVHGNVVHDACFGADGRFVVIASRDGTASVWEVSSGRRLFSLPHKTSVLSAVYSPNGKWIATGTTSGSARVWNAATGQPGTARLRHDSKVILVLFDPTSQRLAAACADHTVHLWSPRTGAELTPPLVHLDDLKDKRAWSFSPDGSRLVTAVAASVQLWDTASGDSVVGPLEMGSRVTSVCFSPEGRRILVAKVSGAAVLFDSATGQRISELLPHDSSVNDAKFSPDGARVLTSSYDHTVRIWPVPTPPLPAPAWLPELAEAIAGHRLNDQDVREVLQVETLFELRQKLLAEPASDFYGRWAQWFFADNVTRSLVPPAEMK